jgi:hypothetical protein
MRSTQAYLLRLYDQADKGRIPLPTYIYEPFTLQTQVLQRKHSEQIGHDVG